MDDIKLMPEKYDNQKEKKSSSSIDFSKKKLGNLGNNFIVLFASWSKLFFVFFIIIIFILLGVWGYRISLTEKKDNLVEKIGSLQDQRHLSLEEDFKKIKKGISSFSQLLDDRIYPTNLFNMLEELTLSNVYFSNFSADLAEGKLTLQAQAQDYTTLAKQILAFEEDPRITNVEVGSAGIDQTGQVSSNMAINFNLSLINE